LLRDHKCLTRDHAEGVIEFICFYKWIVAKPRSEAKLPLGSWAMQCFKHCIKSMFTPCRQRRF